MKTLKLALYFCLCFPPGLLAQRNDTLRIDKALYQGAYAVPKPYLIDTLNLDFRRYDPARALDRNTRTTLSGASALIERGTALKDKGAGLHYFQFTLTPDRYTKVRLVAKHLRNYRVYVDGKAESGSEIKLDPSRHKVLISCLTDSVSKDTFDISVVFPRTATLISNDENRRPFTLADQNTGRFYSSVSLSPSGKYALVGYREVDSRNAVRNSVKLIETATGRIVTQFEEERETVAGRAATPSDREPPYQWLPAQDLLYQMAVRGGTRSLITLNPATLQENVVATNLPNGRLQLAPTLEYALYNASDDGGGMRGTSGTSGTSGTPALRELRVPDDRVSVSRRQNLYRFDLKTGVLAPLTYGHTTPTVADISADGKLVLLKTVNQDLTRIPTRRTTLLLMNMETLSVDTVFYEAKYVDDFYFSPDATQILVKGSPDSFDGIGSELPAGRIASFYDKQLFLYSRATKALRPLTRHFDPSVATVEWSKRDGRIYFTADDRDCTHFFQLDPKTGKIRYYDLKLDVIQGYSVAAHAPLVAAFGQTAETARTLYIASLTDGRVRQIGEIDRKKDLADVEIGKNAEWNFRTTHGDTVCGRFILPPHFDPTKKYPMITYYYGGTTPTKRTLEFNYPLQVLAGQGYVIYVVQPSGAIGYGQEFSARVVNGWGRRGAGDIIEGVRSFCRAHPWVDSTKVGCMGASYGGFMTEYLQTQTDVFAAAISHAGISNLASYWGGGYSGYSYSEFAATGSFPWNNPELYVGQSPLFQADKIHTPLLLLHGTVDTNVPTNESQQLFTALKLLGREVSYVQVDGENHVVSDPVKRTEWQHTIFAWFARWLKGQPEWWDELYPKKNY